MCFLFLECLFDFASNCMTFFLIANSQNAMQGYYSMDILLYFTRVELL